MATLSCFLRAINVGGNRKVPMKDLKALLEGLGFTDVKTLLNSGNVVFTTRKSVPSALKAVEPAIEETFGFKVDCVIKSADELRAALDANPFKQERPDRVVIILTQKPAAAAAVKALVD